MHAEQEGSSNFASIKFRVFFSLLILPLLLPLYFSVPVPYKLKRTTNIPKSIASCAQQKKMASRSRRSSHSSASSSSQDSLSSSGWQDTDAKDDKDDSPPITCLFCSEQFPSSKSVFQHCREKHDFDWNQIAGKSGLGL